MLWFQVIIMTILAVALIVTAGPLSQSLSSLYTDMTMPVAGSGTSVADGSAPTVSEGSGEVATDAVSPRPWVAASRMVAFAASLAMVEAERAAAAPSP